MYLEHLYSYPLPRYFRGRVGVGVISSRDIKNPLPNPLPEYRERE
jgi:hypothetical protein